VCGTVAVPGARFCHHCGSPLPEAVSLAPTERRVVTVLFGDLSEFTAWSEELDPERVGAVTDRVHAATAQAVIAFGGHVDKLIGDGIMAVFGAPVAHEDDPERAVRAALAMQRAVRRVVDEEEGGGRRLGLRVGINTGPVAAGVQAAMSYTVVGDTVNTAARLSDAAGVGGVYAGAATARATRDRVAWRRLPPLRLKGKREPVEAYELLGMRDAPGTRPGLGDEAPFVGREAESGRLNGRLTEAAERGAAQVVVVTAEAGMGKTRLAAEIARHAAEVVGGRALRVRVAPFGDGRLAPLAGLVRQACGVERGDGPERVAEKVRRVVARLSRRTGESEVPTALAADVLLDLLGVGVAGGTPSATGSVPPGTRQTDPVPVAVAGLLTALAAEGPMLVVVDDVHNAAAETVEALGELTSRVAGPVLVLLLGRPELTRTAGRLVRLPDAELMPLPPLSGAASARLLRSYLGGGTLGSADETRLLGTAQGNPFYLAELVSLFIEQGKLTGSAAGWQLAPGSLAGRLLSTDLAAVLAARIDALPPAARAALRDASVVGERVPEGALLALREPAVDGAAELDRALAELVARRMLRRTSRGGWAFVTELTRQAAYAGVGKADLADRHARLVRWADSGPPGDATEVERDAFIAGHAERARNLADAMRLAGNADARAVAPLGVAALARLAAAALDDGQPGRTEGFVDRADTLAEGELPPELVLLRARAWGQTGRYAEALDLLAALLGDDVGDEVRAGSLLSAGEVHRTTGAPGAAAAAWAEAVTVATLAGLPRLTAEALRRLGMLDYLTGRILQAEERFAAAYDTARAAGDRPGQGWALQHLAWAATSRADFTAAEQALETAAALFAEQGNGPGRSWVSGTEAFVRLLQGRLEEARQLATAFLPFGERAGDRWGVAALRTVEAFAAAELGELTHAEEQATEAMQAFTDAGDHWGQSFALVVLGVVARGRGDIEGAIPLLERAMHASRRAAHPLTVGLAATVLGYCLLDSGDAVGAEKLARTTLDVVEPLDLAEAAGVGPVVLLAQARRARGDLGSALDLLAEAAGKSGTPSLVFPRRQALAHYAGTLLESGRAEEALAWAERAREVPAEDVRSRIIALRALASAREATGDLPGARTAVTEARTLAYATEQVGERTATDAVVARLGVAPVG
jgi:class 3 adenylate cyclase/tetratricopeptide (TPR) repeat protein